jgi:hypothetical protein
MSGGGSILRTISTIITAVFTVGIYDRLGPRKDGPDFVDKVAATGQTVYKSLQENNQRRA